mmetsp:Transcript_33608/g.94546  ORF Transcript_33608/g.94546 Transcript_33608/m.94546 type:complete len:247 (-) Transcript_33608:91-831(-)
MAFRHTIGRSSDLLNAVEDPNITGLDFFNMVKGLPGFPWQHEFHPNDIRDARPEELIEDVKAQPQMKKRALAVLSPDARKIFKALQDQAKLHAYTFSLATDQLSDASQNFQALQDAQLTYDTGNADGTPDERSKRNNDLLQAALKNLSTAKQGVLLAAMNMAHTGTTMRNLLLDAAGMDRKSDSSGPISDETYEEMDKALEVSRQDTMAANFAKAVQAATRNNNYYRGGVPQGITLTDTVRGLQKL